MKRVISQAQAIRSITGPSRVTHFMVVLLSGPRHPWPLAHFALDIGARHAAADRRRASADGGADAPARGIPTGTSRGGAGNRGRSLWQANHPGVALARHGRIH